MTREEFENLRFAIDNYSRTKRHRKWFTSDRFDVQHRESRVMLTKEQDDHLQNLVRSYVLSCYDESIEEQRKTLEAHGIDLSELLDGREV